MPQIKAHTSTMTITTTTHGELLVLFDVAASARLTTNGVVVNPVTVVVPVLIEITGGA